MDIPADIRPFWDAFERVAGEAVRERFYEVFHFADNERHANALAKLVLDGTKCATASLLWSYEADAKPLPHTGAYSVVTAWDSTPLCVIETTAVQVVPYNEVTDAFAAVEGEGDGSLSYWRRVHWAYFRRECARIGNEVTADMPVVCEEFAVVYPKQA
ncbi:MAG: ASCH domain-containing protein [Gammaproteobacteria bacterium]|nr:ASCH domain-containing protein [Gammaproteobacteria bacterium]